MPEELVLTDPIVEPEKVTSNYTIGAMTLSGDEKTVAITLRDNFHQPFYVNYYGAEAIEMIKFLNTANFTTKSMHKRLLEKIAADGVLPGTVQGTPDPPSMIIGEIGGPDADAS